MSPLLLNRCAPPVGPGGGRRRVRRWSRGRRAGAPNPPARAFTLGLLTGSVLVLAAYVVSGVVGGWVA